MVTLVADRGPKPFALPRKVRTEEGRAWVRSVAANLRGQGAPRVFDLGDGVIQATIPAAAVTGILNGLANHPRVERVSLAPRLAANLLEGLDAAAIHQQAGGGIYFPSFAIGAAGEEIVIIDGAFDLGHPVLSGMPNVHEYCACGRSNPQSSAGCCPNGQAWQAGAGMGAVFPPPGHPFPADYHGTSVAAVVRSLVGLNVPTGTVPSSITLPPTLPGPTIHGAANGATLHLINIQDRAFAISPGWSGGTIRLQFPGLVEALDRVIGWASTPGRRIRAVSMSFGNLQSSCASDPNFAQISNQVQTLRSLGVMVVAASGNGERPDTVLPGCVPGVMTVAAAEHPSRGQRRACHRPEQAPPWMTCYSTRDATVDIVAPGDMRVPATRVSPGKEGIPITERFVANRPGTSFAAPVVAACAAQMASAWPGWNVGNAETAMIQSPLLAKRCRPTDVPPACNLEQNPYLQCLPALQLANVTGADLNADRIGLSGTYYDIATEGQGFLIDIIPNIGVNTHLLFASWFSYDSPAQAGGRGLRWYVMSGSFASGATSVPVTLVRSSFSNSPAFGLPLASHQPVPIGSGEWRFRSCRQAEFSFWSDELGATSSLPRRRVVVSRDGSTPRCTENPAIELPISVGCTPQFPDALTGTWQRAIPGTSQTDPAHDGRGFLLDVTSGSGKAGNPCSGGGIFGAWYDYAGASDASPVAERFRWATFSQFDPAGRLAPNDFCLHLSLTHGGARLSPYPDAQWHNFLAQPAAQQCPIRLSFQDCNRGTLSYQFGSAPIPGFDGILGSSGSFSIARSVPVSGCALP